MQQKKNEIGKAILCNGIVVIFEHGEDEFYVVPLTDVENKIMRWRTIRVMSFLDHCPYAKSKVPPDVLAKAEEIFEKLPLSDLIEG